MLYLTDAQVASRLAVSRPTVWRWARERNDFPKPVKLSPGMSRWLSDEIDGFQTGLIAARDAA